MPLPGIGLFFLHKAKVHGLKAQAILYFTETLQGTRGTRDAGNPGTRI